MSRPRLLLASLAALVVVVAGVVYLTRDRGLPPPDLPAALDASAPDPFAWKPSRRAELERRAAAGFSHVVYAKSPDGVVSTAERVNLFRAEVEQVGQDNGIDPDLLEGIVFLESAGRPDAVADPKLEGAVGLTQILAETGRNLLKMRVDPASARKLSRQIRRAAARGDDGRAERLRKRRMRIDQRFDPVASLRATARYIRFARSKLPRGDDFAVAGYHMGVGNLQNVLADYGGSPSTYAQLYFDSTPRRHPAAYRRLSGLGDDSSNYLWRVRAGEEIMRLWRHDRGRLERLAQLQTAKNSAEEVLHPSGDTEQFSDPDALKAAYRDNRIRSFPNAPRDTGLARDPQMGELASKLDQPARLYRGLRPEAYALAAYLVRLTREAGGPDAPLTVSSTVRDEKYQALLVKSNIEATRAYSLHTTGYAFDVLRRYRSRRQALAFQYALDRAQALNLIAWVREPAAIHVTAGSEAKKLVPLLRNEK